MVECPRCECWVEELFCWQWLSELALTSHDVPEYVCEDCNQDVREEKEHGLFPDFEEANITFQPPSGWYRQSE